MNLDFTTNTNRNIDIFSQKSTVVQCQAHGKVTDAPTWATNFHSACSVINKPNPNSCQLSPLWQVQKRMKQEQVCHWAKNTTLGSEFINQMRCTIVLTNNEDQLPLLVLVVTKIVLETAEIPRSPKNISLGLESTHSQCWGATVVLDSLAMGASVAPGKENAASGSELMEQMCFGKVSNDCNDRAWNNKNLPKNASTAWSKCAAKNFMLVEQVCGRKFRVGVIVLKKKKKTKKGPPPYTSSRIRNIRLAE